MDDAVAETSFAIKMRSAPSCQLTSVVRANQEKARVNQRQLTDTKHGCINCIPRYGRVSTHKAVTRLWPPARSGSHSPARHDGVEGAGAVGRFQCRSKTSSSPTAGLVRSSVTWVQAVCGGECPAEGKPECQSSLSRSREPSVVS